MSSKLREALLKSRKAMDEMSNSIFQGRIKDSLIDTMGEAQKAISLALAEPIRNCDVGTVDEQEERFHAFCNRHTVVDAQHCNGCPINNIQTEADCVFVWAQLPYEETKGEAK